MGISIIDWLPRTIYLMMCRTPSTYRGLLLVVRLLYLLFRVLGLQAMLFIHFRHRDFSPAWSQTACKTAPSQLPFLAPSERSRVRSLREPFQPHSLPSPLEIQAA